MRFLFFIALVVFAACSQNRKPNSNPPTYIKDLVVRSDSADGMTIFLILGDQQERATSVAGALTLELKGRSSDGTELNVYQRVYPVRAEDFKELVVPGQKTKGTVLTYPVPRIAKEALDARAFSRIDTRNGLDVDISFTHSSPSRLLIIRKTIGR